jgi:hypothetical protein
MRWQTDWKQGIVRLINGEANCIVEANELRLVAFTYTCGFLLGLFFDVGDGGDMFLRKVHHCFH